MVAGASSIIFWCLRCTEQSRPNREMALPYWSARIWTSRCLACLASCMTKIGEPGTSAWTWRESRIQFQSNSLWPKFVQGGSKKAFIKKKKKKTFPSTRFCILIGASTRLSEEVGEILCTVDFTDAFPTTSFWSFHHDRVTNFISGLE